MLKYAPQLSVGFKEDTPENYERLLKDALKRYKEREKELRELIEKESNEYKRNALKSELRSVDDASKLLTNLIQNLQSKSSSCRVAKTTFLNAWQVLKVAFLFPILGRILPGVWDRVGSRLVPLSAGGTVPK
jgi:predicted Zn-dependent peptidase